MQRYRWPSERQPASAPASVEIGARCPSASGLQGSGKDCLCSSHPSHSQIAAQAAEGIHGSGQPERLCDKEKLWRRPRRAGGGQSPLTRSRRRSLKRKVCSDRQGLAETCAHQETREAAIEHRVTACREHDRIGQIAREVGQEENLSPIGGISLLHGVDRWTESKREKASRADKYSVAWHKSNAGQRTSWLIRAGAPLAFDVNLIEV